jgi:hypothetical protein
MYQTQHVIGTSQHPIALWVKDSVGQMPLGSALKVSETLENFTTQFNLFKRHKKMHFEYVIVWAALLIFVLVTQNPDDDDDQDGGMMVPSYQNK